MPLMRLFWVCSWWRVVVSPYFGKFICLVVCSTLYSRLYIPLSIVSFLHAHILNAHALSTYITKFSKAMSNPCSLSRFIEWLMMLELLELVGTMAWQAMMLELLKPWSLSEVFYRWKKDFHHSCLFSIFSQSLYFVRYFCQPLYICNM